MRRSPCSVRTGVCRERGGELRTQRTFDGAAPQAGDRFAGAIAYGDIDGDGTTDVVLGSPGEDVGRFADAGAVTVVCGRTDGLEHRSSQTFTQSGRVAGRPGAGGAFGAAVATGDFDGDGFDDVAIGAPGQGVGGVAGAGAVTVLEGSPGGIRTDSSLAISRRGAVPGDPVAGEAFGAALASGDLDDDGYDDLAIGAPGAGAGAVVVVFGSQSGLDRSRTEIVTQGGQPPRPARGRRRVRGGADRRRPRRRRAATISPSARPARISPEPATPGAVMVVEGNGRGLATTGILVTQNGRARRPRVAGDGYGAAVAIGDLDRDGIGDLVVGVPGASLGRAAGAGRVEVVPGGPSGPDITRAVSIDRRGPTPGRPGPATHSVRRCVSPISTVTARPTWPSAYPTSGSGRSPAGAVMVFVGLDDPGTRITQRGRRARNTDPRRPLRRSPVNRGGA